MLSCLCSRNSAITFDVGTAGIRAFQVVARGSHISIRDSLSLDLLPTDSQPNGAPPPPPDYSRLARLVGQGSFSGSDVGLVLSPPDVRFCTLRLPRKALAQPEKRIREALAWEVAREMRTDAHELEVRYWQLPPGHQRGLNVMAVALPIERALSWYELFARDRLRLRRIDVAPCALVHLACRMWTPAANELWGVLDLGFRRSTLTIVLGQVPTYIRVLSASSQAWTGRLAQAFEVGPAAAEQIKRTHGIRPVERGIRAPQPSQPLPSAEDIPSVVFGLLRESLDDLVREINKCFAYVMQNFPDVNASRFLLAGGGANLRGLAPLLELQLGLPITLLTNAGPADTPRQTPALPSEAESIPWEHPLPDNPVRPETAVAVGGAILDVASTPAGEELKGGRAGARAATAPVNLLPESCHNARRRVVRRNVWTAVALSAGLLLMGTWVALRATDRALLRLQREFGSVQIKQFELERQLSLATRLRNDLAEQGRTLSALWHEEPLPEQLLTLTRQIPDGVVLTEILAQPAGSPRSAAWRPGKTSRPLRPPPRATPPGQSPASEPLVVQLSGYAVDHDELTRLLDVLQRVPQWEQVELLRAAREPYHAGVALAFRLECRQVASGPRAGRAEASQ